MRVHMVKAVRKEHTCHKCGKPILVGQAARTWKHRQDRSDTYRCLDCGSPKPSELTTSDKLQRVYQQQEMLEEMVGKLDGAEPCDLDGLRDELAQACRDAADELDTVKDEYNESADNMESVFTGGNPMIDEIKDKASNLEEVAEALRSAADDLENVDVESTDKDCDDCNGDGDVDCEYCNGTGKITETDDDGNEVETDCGECGASGRVSCDTCEGTGQVVDVENIIENLRQPVNDALGNLSL